MALPPSLKGHRLIFTDSNTTDTRSDVALHTLELYLDYVCPFSASTPSPRLDLLSYPTPSSTLANPSR